VLPKDRKGVGQQQKDEWEEARDLAKQGRFDEIPAEKYIRFRGALHAISRELPVSVDPLTELCNEWYWGETGWGKSRSIRVNYPGFFDKMANKWWDDYRGEEVVVIEELQPEHVRMVSNLKKWVDYNPFRAEVKYGTLTIRPKKFIVTSNYRIRELFPRPGDYGPLERRFTEIYFGPAGKDYETMVSEGPHLPACLRDEEEPGVCGVPGTPGSEDVLLQLLEADEALGAASGGPEVPPTDPPAVEEARTVVDLSGPVYHVCEGDVIPEGPHPSNTTVFLKRTGRPTLEFHGDPSFNVILAPMVAKRVRRQKGAVPAIVLPLPAPEQVADQFLKPVPASIAE